MADITYRTIQPSDDPALARIIRQTLTEYGIGGPGTVFADPETDRLYSLFQDPRSVYYVVGEGESIWGGAGIRGLEGGDGNTCELQKMYLVPSARRKGAGAGLIRRCLDFAASARYRTCYIESMPELKRALHLYESFGFTYLSHPLGSTGHFSCRIWMSKELPWGSYLRDFGSR